MHWDISLVRSYKIQCHYKGSCIFYLYPGDEQNKQKIFYNPKLHQKMFILIPTDNFLGQDIKEMKKYDHIFSKFFN